MIYSYLWEVAEWRADAGAPVAGFADIEGMLWKNYSKVFKIKGTISHVPQIENNFNFCLTIRNVRYDSPNNMQSSQFLSFFTQFSVQPAAKKFGLILKIHF